MSSHLEMGEWKEDEGDLAKGGAGGLLLLLLPPSRPAVPLAGRKTSKIITSEDVQKPFSHYVGVTKTSDGHVRKRPSLAAGRVHAVEVFYAATRVLIDSSGDVKLA